MKLRATLAAGVLAASSVAFGVVSLGTVETGNETIDFYKQASDVVDTTPIGTISADFDASRKNGMAPIAHVETGPATDVQLQRRTVEREVDGELVEETQDIAVVGLSDLSDSFHGFEIVDVTDPASPVSLSRVECGEFHNDVAVWQDIVAVGFDGGAHSCEPAVAALGRENVPTGGAAVYLFDISDLDSPKAIAVFDGVNDADQLELTTGTHNLGIHPDGYLYFATAGFDATEPDLGIVDLNDIDAGATMINMRDISPAAVDGCHDLGFSFSDPEAPLMVCPAIGNTFIWDITAPMAPTEVATIANPGISIHHGGRFTPDGSTVVLGDELAGAAAPSGCFSGGPVGAMWTYDLTVPQAPVPTGYVSASESPGTIETCTSHFYNFVPNAEDKTLSMTGWYGGGMVMHDLTPILEAPLDGGGLIGAGPEVAHIEPAGAEMWNAYAWYGAVYGGSYTGSTGFYIASLEGYTDSADAQLQPYCNDVGIVWGPATDDWQSECRNPGDSIADGGSGEQTARNELPDASNDRAREARSRRGER